MSKQSKIYTRRGDDGYTALLDKERVSKASCHIEAIGCLDEVNAFLGLVLAALETDKKFTALIEKFTHIQRELFVIGAKLADFHDKLSQQISIDTASVQRLEIEIDEMTQILPPLSAFILPNGSEISARIHVARTICRRAERMVLKLNETQPVDKNIIAYLNRLSDWLFTAARFANYQQGRLETIWQTKQ